MSEQPINQLKIVFALALAMPLAKCDIDPIPKVVRDLLGAAKYNKNEMPHPNITDCKSLIQRKTKSWNSKTLIYRHQIHIRVRCHGNH